MTIPDKWKRPPMQAEKEDKQLSHEELVAKLLNTGLARSSMEAKQMAQSMTHIEKTQKQFETEIKKATAAPRNFTSVSSDLIENVGTNNMSRPNFSGSSGQVTNVSNVSVASEDGLVEGIGKSQSLLLKEINSLKDHVARQQQIIERLEQDIAFIRSTLQNTKDADGPKYPRTPTAAELLESQQNDEKSSEKEVGIKIDFSNSDADSEEDSFISPK